MDKCVHIWQLQGLAEVCRESEVGDRSIGAKVVGASFLSNLSGSLTHLPLQHLAHRRQLKLTGNVLISACPSISGEKAVAAESRSRRWCGGPVVAVGGGLQQLQMPPREDLNLPEHAPTTESATAGAGAESTSEGTEQEVRSCC